jgi:hypothetical protein
MLKSNIKLDDLIKSSTFCFDVIPAKTEIQPTIPAFSKDEIGIHGNTVQKQMYQNKEVIDGD